METSKALKQENTQGLTVSNERSRPSLLLVDMNETLTNLRSSLITRNISSLTTGVDEGPKMQEDNRSTKLSLHRIQQSRKKQIGKGPQQRETELLELEHNPCAEKKQQSNYKELYRKEKISFRNKVKKAKKIKKPIQTDETYDVLDTTYTFVTLKMNYTMLTIAFGFMILIRYYTLATLIFVFSNNLDRWGWICVFFLVRFIYFVVVVKVSLKPPESRTELILKKSWNCMESEVHEYFQVLKPRKLVTSIFRGLIPPELSFLYIKTETAQRKFEIYAAINYIYAGIESVVFYPFFIVYLEVIDKFDFYGLNFGVGDVNIIAIIAAVAEGIILGMALFLLWTGFRRKHGSWMLWVRKLFS